MYSCVTSMCLEKVLSQRLVFWNSIHLEVASDSFCFLINSSWLLVFILYVFSLLLSGFNRELVSRPVISGKTDPVRPGPLDRSNTRCRLKVQRVQPLERVNGREDHAFHVFSWICDLNKLLNAEVFRDRAKETSVHVSIESLDRWEAAVSCVFNRRLMSLKLCRMSLKTGTTNVQEEVVYERVKHRKYHWCLSKSWKSEWLDRCWDTRFENWMIGTPPVVRTSSRVTDEDQRSAERSVVCWFRARPRLVIQDSKMWKDRSCKTWTFGSARSRAHALKPFSRSHVRTGWRCLRITSSCELILVFQHQPWDSGRPHERVLGWWSRIPRLGRQRSGNLTRLDIFSWQTLEQAFIRG